MTAPVQAPPLKAISFDADAGTRIGLRRMKILPGDLPLIDRLGLKDWNGRKFDERSLVEVLKWVTNEDKSIIFMKLGGGACEIPEMYDLVYEGERTRVWCGGAGRSARTYVKKDGQATVTIVHAFLRDVPPKLLPQRDVLMALIVEAFAVDSDFPRSGPMTVEFEDGKS